MAKKVLVIEDDIDAASLLITRLTSSGYEAKAAPDATFATKEIHEFKPDLILLDMMLPAGGGMGVLERMNLSVYTKAIPVIMITGGDIEKYKEQTNKYNIKGALKKLAKKGLKRVAYIDSYLVIHLAGSRFYAELLKYWCGISIKDLALAKRNGCQNLEKSKLFTKNEKKIIFLYFCEGKNTYAISKALNVSHQYVSKIIKRIKEKWLIKTLKNPLIYKGYVIVDTKKLKISMRISRSLEGKIEVDTVLKQGFKDLGYSSEVGGHSAAAGAIIETEELDSFLNQINSLVEEAKAHEY